VGGGMFGLTLALRLSQAGHKVKLLEAAPNLGGLADAWRLDDVEWDRHYHVTLLSDANLRKVLSELGLEAEMQWRTTRTGFFTGSDLYPLNDAIDYLRFPPLGLVDKFRLAATIFYVSRIEDGQRLEKIPLTDWLVRLSGRRVFEQIWRPLLRAKLGDNYTQTSAAFIWAVIRRLYAARRSGLKTEMFGYVPGSYARILKHFGDHLTKDGVSIELSCPVASIERDPDGLAVKTAQGTEVFDQVAVTLSAPLAARICKGLNADEVERLNGIVYQGIICASLVLKRPLAGYYLTYITDESIPFTAVVEMSALVDTDQFGGCSLIYLPRYVTADDPYWKLSDEEIEERFRAGLSKVYPELSADDILCFRLSRVRQVLAISTLNYSERLPPMKTSVPGLYIVNSAHIVNGTLNVNETIGLAESVMPQLLAATNQASSSNADMQEQVA
jgi:protoporphyrinogen oxidase